jgi:hypothetical protein
MKLICLSDICEEERRKDPENTYDCIFNANTPEEIRRAIKFVNENIYCKVLQPKLAFIADEEAKQKKRPADIF